MPEGLQLFDGDTLATDYGELTFERGEAMDLQHSFRLSASQPGHVTVIGFLIVRYDEDDSGDVITSVEDERGFLTFR
ncbi:MAG: hypothetical protein M3498_08020 [Deinococcota bacterium]|nr:hypothetical protein [Deinococcota bacterium]